MENKDIGGLAEVAFMYEAKKRGLHIAKPMTDNRKYDFVVDGGKLYRIQVKATSIKEPKKTGFIVRTSYGSKGKFCYDESQVDFFAVFIIPADSWYIIPVGEITKVSTRFYPHKKDCQMERWKEAWYLLQ